MRSRLVYWVLLLLTIFLFINVVRSFKLITMRGMDVRDIQNKLQEEKERQENLKRQLAQVESNQYIEREARNKLNLGKEGEIILLLPSISPIYEPTPTPLDYSANWQKWIGLFL